MSEPAAWMSVLSFQNISGQDFTLLGVGAQTYFAGFHC